MGVISGRCTACGRRLAVPRGPVQFWPRNGTRLRRPWVVLHRCQRNVVIVGGFRW
jgi:hypothetical protein